MSERGYIKFYRSTLGHQFFRDDAERMAWLRLLSAAAWKPYKKRVGEFFVDLQRGEVVGAVRYLASEWRWSKGKVERFLVRMKNEGMIETRVETGITVITICKYNEFQGGEDDDGTPVYIDPGQTRDAAGTDPGRRRDNREEIKHSRKEEVKKGEAESSASLFGTDIVPAVKEPGSNNDEKFRQWYAAYPKKADPKDARKSFDRVLKNKEATFEQLLEGAKRYAAETTAAGTAKNFIKAPAVWLNKGSWANESGAYTPAPQPVSRSDSFIDGLASSLSREDFDERYR